MFGNGNSLFTSGSSLFEKSNTGLFSGNNGNSLGGLFTSENKGTGLFSNNGLFSALNNNTNNGLFDINNCKKPEDDENGEEGDDEPLKDEEPEADPTKSSGNYVYSSDSSKVVSV